MRLRLRIERNSLPPTLALWPVTNPKSTIAQLLTSINDIFPLESGTWGLEDYSVSIAGFECLHYHEIESVCKEDDEVVIRPLQWVDVRSRTVTGRTQISGDGRRLVDGVPFGRAAVRAPVRPEIVIPPRKRGRLLVGEEVSGGVEESGQLFLTEHGEEILESEDDEEEGSEDEEESTESTEGSDSKSESESDGSGPSIKSSKEVTQPKGHYLSPFDSEPDEDGLKSDTSDTSEDGVSDESSELTSSSDDSSSETSESEDEAKPPLKQPASQKKDLKQVKPATIGTAAQLKGVAGKKRKREQGEQQRQEHQEDDDSVRIIITPLSSTAPGEGKLETASRNARRRDTKRLKLVQRLGLLPASTNLDGMRSWQESTPGWEAVIDEALKAEQRAANVKHKQGAQARLQQAVLDVEMEDAAAARQANGSVGHDGAQDLPQSKPAWKKKQETLAADGQDFEQQRAKLLAAINGEGVNVTRDITGASKGSENCLAGLSFVFLGQIDGLSRKQGSRLVREYGGMVMNGPTGATDYVVIGKDVQAEKLELIQKYGLETIDKEGFFELIRARPVTGEQTLKANSKQEEEQALAGTETPTTEDIGAAVSTPSLTQPRARLDLLSSQRLLFGSLGMRVPKTPEERERAQKKLAESAKRNPVVRAEEATSIDNPRNAVLVNGEAAGAVSGTSAEEDDSEAWKQKIDLGAVECCEEGMKLSTPPFPFHQRWDPQQWRKKAGKRNLKAFSDGGRKRKKAKVGGEYLETYDKYNQDGNGDALNYDDKDGWADDEYWEDGALLNDDGEDDGVIESEFPLLPSDLGALQTLAEMDAKANDFIAYTSLACDEATNWQPKVVTRVAKIISGTGGGMWTLQLSDRDRKAKVFDEDGNRVYSKFEMPDEEDMEEGMQEQVWAELGEVRLVKRAGGENVIVGEVVVDGTV